MYLEFRMTLNRHVMRMGLAPEMPGSLVHGLRGGVVINASDVRLVIYLVLIRQLRFCWVPEEIIVSAPLPPESVKAGFYPRTPDIHPVPRGKYLPPINSKITILSLGPEAQYGGWIGNDPLRNGEDFEGVYERERGRPDREEVDIEHITVDCQEELLHSRRVAAITTPYRDSKVA